MRFDPVQIITSGDMSQSTVTSLGLDMNQMVLASIQAVYTGSPVGTLKLQISNDIVSAPPGGGTNLASLVTNWSDYTGSSLSISAAGDFTYNLLDIGYRWLRLVYTKSSGTGTINATFCGKGI